MRFSIQKQDFLKPLQTVVACADHKSLIPILSHVLIDLNQNGVLTLTGADHEIQITRELEITDKSAEAGKITVPARKLFDLVKSVDDEAPITLKTNTDNTKTNLTSGRSRFSLSSLSPNEYPFMESEEVETSLFLPQRDLKRIIEQVSFAMAQKDVRYYLNGLLLEVQGKELRAVATDGHRLAKAKVAILSEVESEDIYHVILPRKIALELPKILNNSDEPITLSLKPRHVELECDGLSLISRKIDGKFPDYNQVIPSPDKNTNVLTIGRVALLKALTRVVILSNEKYRGITFHLTDDTLKLDARNPQSEESEELIEVDYNGPIIEVGLNANYVQDVLNSYVSDDVRMAFDDANAGILILDPDDESVLSVCMPMRL